MNLLINIEDFMLPCLWKQTFNIDCFGCGFQRSLVMLFKGDFIGAFYMYPAIYSIIVMLALLILHTKFQFKHGPKILIGLFILNISIIVISYFIKHY
ncbi:MAG: DUF2752 domain-containing protein [Winogradskyella sp.]|nr:DUF2752 domain-containing protein [Winogradskyella sp.]NNF86862.1 DUF2752 domain-containing protein [Winogradskyella sp.]NNK39227.1 DUF2752 domain-containing protein [Winogradskyella sp.]